MGLFGALFAGVSGLDSQSNKIGIISNNISNVNTVGFKQGQASFDTLVVPSGTTSFSPGGVIGSNQQLVNQQGVISATTSPTDIAISGGGMLFVSAAPVGAGATVNPLFTRDGSFTQDANGNFINSNDYYLLGASLASTSGVPYTSINQSQLTTVNVSSSATGSATPTSNIVLGANFNAAQSVLLGNGVTASMASVNGTSPSNAGIPASQIIVDSEFGVPSTSNLTRGDSVTIQSGNVDGGSGTQNDVFTYGGYTVSRDVTDTIDGTTTTGDGDGTAVLDPNESIAANSITTNTTAGTQNQITISNVTNGVDYVVSADGYANISGVTTGVANLTPADINGEWKIVSSTANSVTVEIATNATSAATGGSTLTLTNRTYPFTGNILNATTAAGDFMGTGTSAIDPTTFASTSLSFNITVAGGIPSDFTYSATPDPTLGQFNSLDSLATAISDTPGLTASVTDGRLYVSATNANDTVAFANGNAAGDTAASPPLPGINWIQELDLPTSLVANVNAGNSLSPSTNYFNTLSGLANQINSVDPTNLLATVNNPTGESTLSINEANPEQTITFTDNQATTPSGSVLAELGIPKLSANGSGENTTGKLGIIYSPASAATNMSSGAVTPQFSKDITIYDAQGNPHTVAFNVVKIGINTWGVELTAVPASDILPVGGDGLIASGTVIFNGNGTLKSIQAGGGGSSINGNISIAWANGASTSTITMNLGTPGESNGLTQAAGSFNVATDTQNGSPTGELTGVSINADGIVIASFSNGQTQNMFQLPLANFTNPDGLESISGDAYQATLASGPINPVPAGTSGVGTFTPSALEQSNVDLSTQLTDLIVAQQAYGANSKVLTIADDLLQELDQIIQS